MKGNRNGLRWMVPFIVRSTTFFAGHTGEMLSGLVKTYPTIHFIQRSEEYGSLSSRVYQV